MSKKRVQQPCLVTNVSDVSSGYNGVAVADMVIVIAVVVVVLTENCDCDEDFWPEASPLD
jgi:hypothetical protein